MLPLDFVAHLRDAKLGTCGRSRWRGEIGKTRATDVGMNHHVKPDN